MDKSKIKPKIITPHINPNDVGIEVWTMINGEPTKGILLNPQHNVLSDNEMFLYKLCPMAQFMVGDMYTIIPCTIDHPVYYTKEELLKAPDINHKKVRAKT